LDSPLRFDGDGMTIFRAATGPCPHDNGIVLVTQNANQSRRFQLGCRAAHRQSGRVVTLGTTGTSGNGARQIRLCVDPQSPVT
jgi:hypothetical protein